MVYWKHVSEVDAFVSPGHIRTFYRRLVGFDDGIENVEMFIGEMKEGGTAVPYYHDDLERILYILDGKMQVIIDGMRAELTAGHVVWVPKGTFCEVSNAGPGAVRYVLYE